MSAIDNLASVIARTRTPLWLYRVTNAGRTRSTNVLDHTGRGAREQGARLFREPLETIVVVPIRLFARTP